MAIHEDMLDELRQRIQSNMHDKFGLTPEEADQTSKLFSSHIKNITNKNFFKENKEQILGLLPDLSNIRKNKLFDKLSSNFSKDLVNKIGIPKETAERIKDFSMDELVDTLKREFRDAEGNLDLSNLLKKVGLDKFEAEAKDIVGNISKLFSK